MTTAGLGKAAAGGASATAFWQLIRLGILALSIVILARLLDPADYGLIAMVTAIIGIGELLRDMGLSMASVQARTLTTGEKSNLFWINSAIGAVLTIVVFALASPIATFYGRPELENITRLLSLTFLLNGIATQFKAQINRDLRFMTLGAAEAVPQALGLIAAIVWAVTIGGYGALVTQALVIAGAALLMDVAFARWFPGWIARDSSVRRFLGFGGALMGTQSLAYLSKNLDTILLGLTVGSAQLGFYNRAYQIVVLPLTQLTAPLSRVAIPVLSRVQDNAELYSKYLKTGQFFSVAAASSFYGLVIGLAVPLVSVVLGPAWLPAAPILQVLAVSGIFRVMGQVPYWLFLSKGYAGKQFRFYLVAQPVILVGIVLGLPFGPVGVATGLAAGYAVFWVTQMLWASRATSTPTIGLTVSALTTAVLFAGPVALIGRASESWIGSEWITLMVGVGCSIIYVLAVAAAVPRYRTFLVTAARAMKRKS